MTSAALNDATVTPATTDIESLQYAVDYFSDGMFAAEARAEAAEAESARLREALKPFADLGREFGRGAMQDCIWTDDMKIEGVNAYNNGTDYHITLGDLRRAGEALYAPCVHQLRRMT